MSAPAPVLGGGSNAPHRIKRGKAAHAMRILAVPIIGFWIVFTVVVNVIAPQLEIVGEEHAAPMAPKDAPSMIAMKRMGGNFQEFDSNSTVMIVIDSDQELGPPAHAYYDEIIAKLEKDPEHVQHIQNFWGQRLTAAGAQGADAKGAYVMLNLAGEQGLTLANESVQAVRKVIADTPAPDGVHAYVTGPAALSNDMHIIGNASLAKITLITLIAIAFMLLVVYRSIITTIVQLILTFTGLLAARGVVSVLAMHGAFELTTFAGNILTMLAIAAATDYGIFLFGRYREARQSGLEKDDAYYVTFHSVSHVIIGSGLTIAGAVYCLSFARLTWFKTMGEPVAIGMLVVIASAVTMGPAALFLGSKIGLYDPKTARPGRFWYKVGTAVVRWPAPIFVVSLAIVLIGMLGLPGYRTDYNDKHFLPMDAPSNLGYQAAARHFTEARMNPDILMVESDHDMRNTADILVLDKVARNLLGVEGIAMVQSISRPLGIPIQHSSIPFQNAVGSQVQNQSLPYLKERMGDIKKMSDQMGVMITTMTQMYSVMQKLVDNTHDMKKTTDELVDVVSDLRDHMADFDDFFRPLRNYLYWEPHCYDIPMCWSIRSLFDGLDGFDQMSDKFGQMSQSITEMDRLMPQMLALVPPMIASMKTTQALTLTTYSTFQAMIDQLGALNDTAIVMGQTFDDAKNGDLFYLPPEAFDNPDFQVGLKQFLSPDGKSARFFITHEGDPATPEGIDRVAGERKAGQDALKMSSLSGSRVFIGGTAATYKDMHDGAKYDLMISVVASLTLIFMIMLILVRSAVAALVIVATAASSIAASFGLSVLIWQDLFGFRLHWLVAVMSVIILLAVGSDYNLLLVSRFKEEIHAGLKTGIIRAMGGTGGVVTSAGMVFAATMAGMLMSDLTVLAQMGSTIAIGLILDTFIVRSLLMPSIATMLGRWFWWPMVVHPRGEYGTHRRPSAPVLADQGTERYC
ncbi:membrane protein [Mycolicibacterium insubricum]|nr:MMPL family transporter [Mycolicibacterium sp.]BBZ65864.1 membrane protein [Mycolicibacterium insubricum]